jgi:hypothetical protein
MAKKIRQDTVEAMKKTVNTLTLKGISNRSSFRMLEQMYLRSTANKLMLVRVSKILDCTVFD